MSRSHNGPRAFFSQLAHIPEAKPKNNFFVVLFKNAVPVRTQNIDGLYLQPMFLSIFNKDTWCIKSHRLRIQQARREGCQIMALQIATGIRDQPKTVSM